MKEFPCRFPAISVEQPFGTFFVTVIPADLLRKVAFSDRVRVAEADSSGYRVTGTQRRQREERWAEIGKFIDTAEAVFPTSIVLAANYREDGLLEDGGSRWSIEPGNPATLVIPTDEPLASVVDGQHRLWAFDFANDSSRADMPLACSVFLDLPNPYQAYLFATVNFNQKKVDRSLAYELWGFDTEDEPPPAWTPEKTAVFLTRRLNMDDKSPLRGRILIAALDDQRVTQQRPAREWAVSTATVADGLLRLFSRNPTNDRSEMFMKPRSIRRRSDLPNDNTPARELFRQTNDKAIYLLANNFLTAADKLLWQPAGTNSSIIRTVGIQALFDILQRVAADAIEARTLTEAFFANRLLRANDGMKRANEIDFSQDFFQASGKGRVRIKHTLALAMGLESLDDTPNTDRPTYAAIVGTT